MLALFPVSLPLIPHPIFLPFASKRVLHHLPSHPLSPDLSSITLLQEHKPFTGPSTSFLTDVVSLKGCILL